MNIYRQNPQINSPNREVGLDVSSFPGLPCLACGGLPCTSGSGLTSTSGSGGLPGSLVALGGSIAARGAVRNNLVVVHKHVSFNHVY